MSDLADGGVFAQVAAANADHVEVALSAAHAAKHPMRETTIVERTNWLEEIADEVGDRKAELAEVIVREEGKTISRARGEVDAASERFRRAAAVVYQQKGEFIEASTEGHEG